MSAVIAAALLLTACNTKDPIFETEHSEHGKITLTTDWSGISPDLAAPGSYKVVVGGYSATLTGTVNTLNYLFEPGDYTLHAYNEPDNIAVSGTTATADYSATPGWFYSCTLHGVAIDRDRVHAYTAVMRQQVGQFTLVITPGGGTAERIAAITATLSGVAGTVDTDTQAHGSAVSVPLVFSKGADGRWTATVRLLGIVEDVQQRLAGTITFTDGVPADIVLESDLTGDLTAFNAEKNTPLSLSGTIQTPSGAGFTATITDWTSVPGSSVIAN